MIKHISSSNWFFLVCILVSLSLISGCAANTQGTSNSPLNSSITLTSKNPATTTPEKPVITDTTANLLKLKTISFVDEQGTGTEAYKMLIPADWEYEGGLQWVFNNPGMPAISQTRVWNPRGTEEFYLFPNQALFWTDNPGILQLFPPGSRYFGNEVMDLLNPLNALREVVIPRFRPDVQAMKITREEEITDIDLPADASSSPLQTSTKAGKIRIEYNKDGIVYEDEIYCTVEATYYPLQSTFGSYTNILWGINNIASFRAEKGKLDASARIFQTISNSVTLNINWFNTYIQVVEYLIKMEIQHIQSIGQLGSIIAQTGSEIRQENLDLYYQRESMNDSISTQYSEYVRGVDSYYNPIEAKNVEIPTGYDNVWVNNLGEYILTDNPNYNPNIGGNQNYQKLEPAQK